MAARMGILVKGGKVLQSVKEVRTIIFDKTGTLTDGKPKTHNCEIDSQGEEARVMLSLVKSMSYLVEKNSEHPIAKAIADYCKADEGTYKVNNFETFDGQGVVGTFDFKD